ncbi:MAG: hypothetical protein ACYTF5_16760 [Planctomycetota bacterium]|jgi:hypothetical protein
MRRRWRYRADGTKYEVPIERDYRPQSAVFLGDKTLERKMASEGKVPVDEWRGVQQDAAARRDAKAKAQKKLRRDSLIHAAKRHTSWL